MRPKVLVEQFTELLNNQESLPEKGAIVMRRLLFSVIFCLLLILLAGCSKSDKEAKSDKTTRKFPLRSAVLKAAATEISSTFRTIRTYQTTYKIENGVYRECYPSPPNGGTDAVADVWVDAGGFEDIGFRPEGSVRYQYAVAVSDDGKSYIITATGDLDGNGVRVVHTATNSNRKPTKEPANEY